MTGEPDTFSQELSSSPSVTLDKALERTIKIDD
jgi:hypothetical protein